MEQQATVIETDGINATVRGSRASACGGCAGKASCSTMGSWRERLIELQVKNSIGAKAGDEVLLEVPDGLLLKVAFRIYAIPMLMFVVAGGVVSSLATAMHWPAPELLAAVTALLCVPITYLFLLRRKRGSEASLDVRMLRIVGRGEKLIPILPVSASE
ncbi:positive regulator of sigma(E), RseC/MucC [Mariprofundus ferrinatatus]|uniref:Positive regulator of sigma(E), RseC/MucC n=1 Tax=Mariprofundus ferrinatatus TaxID=1921087 RepID=A0A2K8LA17_9PROT|nr:SoxR reducing system RseC family protein [Mariprofundus ferrinatatus]ATX81116.1 positive regulator of sigma(E), RseC/MucC [Mariprofundus ferrinatatus]